MPYIKQEDRRKYDTLINELIKTLPEATEDSLDGELNYLFSTIINKKYPLRYVQMNRCIGMLECVKQEYYRRTASPYEDQKIKQNGDIK